MHQFHSYLYQIVTILTIMNPHNFSKTKLPGTQMDQLPKVGWKRGPGMVCTGQDYEIIMVWHDDDNFHKMMMIIVMKWTVDDDDDNENYNGG